MRTLAVIGVAVLIALACGSSEDSGGAGGEGGGGNGGQSSVAGGSGGGSASGGAAAAGASTNGGTGGSRFGPRDSGISVLTSALGEACLEDADCGGPSLFCLRSDGDAFEPGGPARGLCVADCSTHSDCQAIDTQGLCLQVAGIETARDQSDDVAYCFLSCEVGDSDAISKCRGREELTCQASSQVPLGYCWPTCRSDADCDGRVCDLGSGLCVDAADIEGTLPIGSRCEFQSDCEGNCLQISDGYSICSGLCSIGSDGCGEVLGSDEPQEAACLLSQVPGLSTRGDAAFCMQLCDCNDDCHDPDAVCYDEGLEDSVGRRGLCYVTDPGDAAATPGISCTDATPDSGSGGSGGSGSDGGTDGAGGAGGTGGTDAGTDAGDGG